MFRCKGSVCTFGDFHTIQSIVRGSDNSGAISGERLDSLEHIHACATAPRSGGDAAAWLLANLSSLWASINCDLFFSDAVFVVVVDGRRLSLGYTVRRVISAVARGPGFKRDGPFAKQLRTTA